jgi:hypothetical protein
MFNARFMFRFINRWKLYIKSADGAKFSIFHSLFRTLIISSHHSHLKTITTQEGLYVNVGRNVGVKKVYMMWLFFVDLVLVSFPLHHR